MLVAHTRVYQDNSSFATATSVSFFPHTSLRIRLTGQPCPHQSIDSLSCLAALAYCGPYSSEHLVKNSRQTCCADSGFLSPDPECRFVYFKCCGLRAARSIQVSDAHSGDINVGVYDRGEYSLTAATQWRSVSLWWDIALSSVLSRALDTEHRASARFTGARCCFCSAGVVDFRPVWD